LSAKPTHILGISAYYHDSAACLVTDGQIVAAAQEERFSRKRHDPSFPKAAIAYCLREAGLNLRDLDHIVYYEKPLLTFDRLLETYFHFAPRGLVSYLAAMPVWLKEKLFLRKSIAKEFEKTFGESRLPSLLFSEHHESHAASAFYPSPFQEAAVLCMDGVGEWATTSAWVGRGSELQSLWEIRFPHSLGLLYSAFTYYTGFKVNSGEYKVMGLAPYGEPKYVKAIYDHLIDVKTDGTFRLNMEKFGYCTGLRMTNSKFDQVFGGPPRKPESQLTQREMDLARSIQVVTEEVVLKLAHKVKRETGLKQLCLAGGVALNCVANGRLLHEGPFEKIWIQPAAGDAGGAIGCALAVWHEYLKKPRSTSGTTDSMQGAFLGPKNLDSEIRQFLDKNSYKYRHFVEEKELLREVAQLLSQQKVGGWHQGRMEFGPRSLGARSIIADSTSTRMQSEINLKVKFRESFRPFAPAVTQESAAQYFDLSQESPYMLLVAPVLATRRKEPVPGQGALWGIDLLKVPRSDIPAVTHVDYSARVQTVNAQVHPRFHALLEEFGKITGHPILVNTSFNVRGEPIVCTPEDSYRCFMRTGIDFLVLENNLLLKSDQPKWNETSNWREEFALD